MSTSGRVIKFLLAYAIFTKLMYEHSKGKNYITIIIPVKNEEDSIIKNLELLRNLVIIPHYVILVDGCSIDNTFNLVTSYIKKNREILIRPTKNIRIIRTPPNKSGFKDSIDLGIKAAATDIVVVMMGDLCDDPKTINKMYDKLQSGYDIIVGSRYMPGGNKIAEPKIQGFLSRTVNKTLHTLTGIPIHDVSNPFRMYKKKLYSEIKTMSKGNEIPIEILFKAHIDGARIAEVPTTWRGRKSGKSKFKLLKVIPGYARLYFWILLNAAIKRFNKIKTLT